MTADPAGADFGEARIRARYVELTGAVPPAIETRLALAARTGRRAALGAVEALRDELIMANR